MWKLTEAEHKKLVRLAGTAQRFSEQLDRQKIELDQARVDLDLAWEEVDYLEQVNNTHRVVLSQTWGMWAANRRMIQSLRSLFTRRWSRAARAWLGAWLEEDAKAMTGLLDWADKQVRGIGVETGSEASR